jgi:hypothetical protein
MTDLYDKATEAEQLQLECALQAQRKRAECTEHLQPVGECLNPHCAEEFAPEETTRLFCNQKCAAEYSRIYSRK